MIIIVSLITQLSLTLSTKFPSPNDITDVYMVIMNHFDCGYNDPVIGEKSYAINVINEYFDIYFPRAVSVGMNISTTYNKTYKWTTQSWLISLYFDCPLFMGLHCPNQSAKNYILYGIKQQYIIWHSFPFNSQIEYYDPSLIQFGLKLSKDVSIQYNLSYIPSVMSQRDVPGITKAILPILLNNNISALSIGSNDGSTPPNVPRIFKWKSSNNKYLITMLHPYGYGGINISDAILINNFSTAFVTAFKSDNKGPPTVEQTLNYYITLKTEFPNANIISTSFDEYINLLLLPQNKYIIDSLPIIHQEMGDTWTWGISSDPMKNILFRIAMRKRNQCLNVDKLCSLNDIAFYNFSRFLLKNGEHTWGGGITHFLTLPNNYYAWSNKEFENRLNDRNNETNEMIKLRKSWYEQRDLGLTYALQALSLSNNSIYKNLYNNIISEWNKMYESESPLNPINDWDIINSSNSYDIIINNHIFELKFDDNTGAISILYDRNTSINYADISNDNLLGEFIYQSLNEMDYMEYMNEYVPYNKHAKPWKDESKIGIEEFGAAEHQYITATLINLYRNKNNNLQFICELSFNGYSQHLQKYYGGPTKIYNFINFDNNNTNSISFDMEITWINKTATRLPESLWFKFNPLKCSNWSVNKLNEEIYLSDIMNGGALHFMSTTGNVTCIINQSNNEKFKILSIDAPGIGFISKGKNELFALPTPFVNISQDKGCGFCLYNNLWGTNYIMWFPYDQKEKNITHRFRLYLSTN